MIQFHDYTLSVVPAYMVLIAFLVGVLLVQRIIGLYLSYIHTEAQNRPLYILSEDKSLGLK